ncbi:MAG: hypothetical protein MUC97_15825 [Bernardetiaceae bacterium]|jgi:hypothetical protein|nr:hypothetical protein [Bernardetiaceae bacterium]
MKRTQRVLFLAACWLALGFSCGREPQPCIEEEVGTPIPLEEALTTLLLDNCWLIPETARPINPDGPVTDMAEYVINSPAEFRALVGCPATRVPDIDFTRYTLIAGQKFLAQAGFVETQSLANKCGVIHYEINLIGAISTRVGVLTYFAVVPKMGGKPTIVYHVSER